jgi:CMP-N,N'-diacetyllegionaminic acid synthase
MFEGHRVLVVVPARGGSKGIPLKNLQPVAGRPLIALAGDIVRSLGWVDRAVVSTDHLLIAEAARDAGLEVPFMRPPGLSGDFVGDAEVLVHALRASDETGGVEYDLVVMLQPTSPLRRPEHVNACVEKLVTEDLDAVWTVSPTELKAHPLKQLTVGTDGRLDYWDERGQEVMARQQLTPVYHRNGAAYALTRSCLLQQAGLKGTRTGAVIIDEPMISIDTLDDIRRVEAVLAARRLEGSETGARTRERPRRIVVDIDGVLAEAVPDLDYDQAGPIPRNVARVNALHDAGCHLVLFTARGSTTGRDWSSVTRTQLERWGVRYHELKFGKPAADYYVDDRLITLTEALALCGVPDPVAAEQEKA